MDTVLIVTNAVKMFGNNKALDNATFELRSGEWLAMLGPNGAGKTTVVRSIAGRVRLDSGTLTLLGRSLNGAADRYEKLGIVPQEIALYPRLSAAENLASFGQLLGLSGAILKERVDWALDFTGLSDRSTDPVNTFSGGMKRRLNIACGVLHRPPVVLLDEPTVGVDPQSRQRIWEMLDRLRREGASLLLTTHQLDEAQQVCDRIVVIDHGRVIAQGTFEELVQQTIGAQRTVSITLDLPAQPVFGGLPGAFIDGTTARCLVSDVGPQVTALLSRAAAAHATVVDLQIESPTLQAVFIHLTGRELRD